MGFNRARMLEATGSLQAAVREYRELLQAFPGYTDCHMRLAYLAMQRGDSAEAMHWVEQALEVKPGLVDAKAMLGKLCSHFPSHSVRRVLRAASHCLALCAFCRLLCVSLR
jgi:tetratricopeptide (TPR) repeat protein